MPLVSRSGIHCRVEKIEDTLCCFVSENVRDIATMFFIFGEPQEYSLPFNFLRTIYRDTLTVSVSFNPANNLRVECT